MYKQVLYYIIHHYIHIYKYLIGNTATSSTAIKDKCRHLTSLLELFPPLTQPKITSLRPEMSLFFVSDGENSKTACEKGESMRSVFLTSSIQQVLVHLYN